MWRAVSASAPSARQIIATYLVLTALFNGAMALIWGVNTLFLMSAGLDIFQVMLVNSIFSFGQLVFEVPTGVIADTVGRRASLLLCLLTLLVSTLAYLAIAWLHLGFWSFAAVSVLLGLGFTFYTGAVDAWLVDALAAVGYREPLEPVFARMQVVFGAAMLVGTLGGGALGQVHLSLPYLLRAALIVPTIAVAWRGMHELGFTPRTLRWRALPTEMKAVFDAGVQNGLRHRVVLPLMLASLVAATFSMFGFYSWQRYFLDLLGRDRVWVTGVIAAAVAGSMMIGNVLVSPLSAVAGGRTRLLIGAVLVQSVAIMLCGMTTHFFVAVALYLVYGIASGAASPIKQGYLNAHIPSAQRATIISLDSLFADLGGGVGQSGWGYLARLQSIGTAWLAAGALLLLGAPFYLIAGRRDRDHDVIRPA
jgi:MFS family permease